MSNIQTRTELKTILDTISATVLPVKFNYPEGKPTSFPAAVITWLGETEKTFDTQYNDISQQWVISLIFAAEESDQAMTKWLTLRDALGAEFRKDEHITLNGNAIHCQLKNSPPPSTTTEGYMQPVVIFDLIFEVRIIKDITT